MAALVVCSACLYRETYGFGFVGLDDPGHVSRNPLLEGGLTWANAVAAFSAPHQALYIPLTWISFMIERSLFGLDAGISHLLNALMHGCASALLFAWLRAATGRFAESGLAALLFLVHPVNVESVAWISERKNVLCMAFAMASLWAYARYAASGSRRAWCVALTLFGCALLAKPMAVTLPCAMLLLDVWPHRRWGRVPLRRLFVEKAPYFALAVAVSAVTAFGSAHIGAAVGTDALPWAARFSNAAESYARYFAQYFAPVGLGLNYQHPGEARPAGWIAAAVLLAATASLWRTRAAWPAAWVGWLWFLGTLVPSIGLVQVGMQARADRFMYLPQIGLLAAVIWTLSGVLPAAAKRVALLAALTAAAALSAVSTAQIRFWENTETLARRTLALDPGNTLANQHLGKILDARSQHAGAVVHLRRATERGQPSEKIWNDLGRALAASGDTQAAVAAFRSALALEPRSVAARGNLAIALAHAGHLEEAERAFRSAIALDPARVPLLLHYGRFLETRGRPAEALARYREAARLAPRSPEIAAALRRLGAEPPP